MIIEILESVCLCTAILIVWFETEAFVEYAKLFRLDMPFDIVGFENHTAQDFTNLVSYPKYLVMEHDCFFTRMISCAFCLGFWLSLFSVLVFDLSFSIAPVTFVFSLMLYFVMCKLYK